MSAVTPIAGDMLVVEKASGRADVFRRDDSGHWVPARTGQMDVSDPHRAWEIARSNFGPGGSTVWYRLESEPDAAVQPYQLG
jgi:hypothetical protein